MREPGEGGHRHGHRGPWPPPWAGGGRPPGFRLRRGHVRSLILAALLEGPAHGYELIRRLEEQTGGMWRPSAGSVYPTLQVLEGDGLARSTERGGRRIYELTQAGRQEAEEGPGLAEGLAGGPPEAHVALHRALEALAMAARQVQAAGDEDTIARAAQVVTGARQELYRLLAEG